jgi:hypothetical protein
MEGYIFRSRQQRLSSDRGTQGLIAQSLISSLHIAMNGIGWYERRSNEYTKIIKFMCGNVPLAQESYLSSIQRLPRERGPTLASEIDPF